MGKFEAEEAALIDSYGAVCGEAAAWTDEKGKQFQGELAESMRACLALKEAADRAVDACTEEERFLLEYKYFRRRKELRGRFSGAEVSCSERNYFRRQAALLRKMVSELGRRGWTERAFLEAFGAFAPFMRAFRALSEGQEGKLVAHRGKRDIRFRTEVRSRKVRS